MCILKLKYILNFHLRIYIIKKKSTAATLCCFLVSFQISNKLAFNPIYSCLLLKL